MFVDAFLKPWAVEGRNDSKLAVENLGLKKCIPLFPVSTCPLQWWLTCIILHCLPSRHIESAFGYYLEGGKKRDRKKVMYSRDRYLGLHFVLWRVVFIFWYSFSKTAVGRGLKYTLLNSCQIKSFRSMLHFLLNENTESRQLSWKVFYVR